MNEARAVTVGGLVVCGAALLGSAIPGVNDFLNRWVLVLGVAGLVVAGAWAGVWELRDWLFWQDMATPHAPPVPAEDEVAPVMDGDPVEVAAEFEENRD